MPRGLWKCWLLIGAKSWVGWVRLRCSMTRTIAIVPFEVRYIHDYLKFGQPRAYCDGSVLIAWRRLAGFAKDNSCLDHLRTVWFRALWTGTVSFVWQQPETQGWFYGRDSSMSYDPRTWSAISNGNVVSWPKVSCIETKKLPICVDVTWPCMCDVSEP